jgi:LysM repeat protein
MMKFIPRQSVILITLILFRLLSADIIVAQVPVIKSTEKVIIRGNTYYIHTVAKGQTSFSIARAYSISVETLHGENPEAVYGIREGQVLKIPVVVVEEEKKETRPRDTEKYIYHTLAAGETIYSLSRRYDVSQALIEQANPGLAINDMPIGMELAIPKKELKTEIVSLETAPQEEFTFYRVRQGENLSYISRKFGVPTRELRRANGGLLFPRANDIIRIPGRHTVDAGGVITQPTVRDTAGVVVEEEVFLPSVRSEFFTDISAMRGKVDIAVMLPLFLAENSNRIEADTTGNTRRIRERPFTWIHPRSMSFLEMYEGILLAADDLRKSGLDVNIHTYDTRADLETVDNILATDGLRNMDLIIGPIYSFNVERVVSYAARYNIPVISPVPLRNNMVLQGNPELYVVNPFLKTVQERLAVTIAQHYESNIVFIYSDTATVDNESLAFRDMIMSEIAFKENTGPVSLKQVLFRSISKAPLDTLNRLSHALNPFKENIIVLATEDESALNETIMSLHTLSRRYNMTVFAYPSIRGLEQNIEISYFCELGINFFAPFRIDYSDDNVKRFLLNYRNTYKTEPSETSFAWVGYDITTWFVSGLALHGNRLMHDPAVHNPRLLHSQFDFRRSSSANGFENKGLLRLKYTKDIELVKVDEPSNGINKK